jgi:hypothetical protein
MSTCDLEPKKAASTRASQQLLTQEPPFAVDILATSWPSPKPAQNWLSQSFLAKDRCFPVVLDGIILKDNNDTLHCSTNLLAIVEFHLDYQTSTGQPLSIKFATGEDGSVNCLLDMSFIKAAKLIVVAHDNVVESKLLECKPFDIESKHPMRCQPNLIQRNQPSAEKNFTVINAIDKACAFISTCVKSVPSVEETNNEKTKVAFNFDNKCLESKNPGEQSASQPVAN